MILKQYYLGCLAHASYLIGDEQTGTAVVVDPQRDVDQYLADAEQQRLQIRHVFLTHFHADFLAGHLELRNRTKASIHLGAAADAEYPFVPMHDGDTLEFGRVRLKILETPGHTPEGISLLVFDLSNDREAPHAVLTGDTLFIGDVGRPDLIASVGVTATELGRCLYHSLREKLLTLPDETLVYPAHGAGSMCGKNLSSDTVSNIGIQRRYNYALQPMDENEFLRLVTAEQPEAPAYFSYDAVLNRQERPTLEQSLQRSLRALSLAEVLRLAGQGAQLIDVRDALAFAGAHMKGAINIGLAGKFATVAGTLLDREQSIVLIGDPGMEEEAATRLGRIGLDRVAGYLEGGMLALSGRDDIVQRLDRITPTTLAERLGTADAPLVVDVRSPQERKAGRIEASIGIPLNEIDRRIDELPRDRLVVTYCATGYRSSAVASLLQKRGVTKVIDLVGGFTAWQTTPAP